MFDWLRRNKRNEQKASAVVTSHDLLEQIFGGWESETGLKITWRQAIKVSAVLACVRVLANGVSQVPFVLYSSSGRWKERATGHPLYDLVHLAPNEYQTSFDFRSMMMMHLCLTNNAFVWVNRYKNKVLELLPLLPGSVIVERDGWKVQYRITGESGSQYVLPPSEVWHVRNMAWDGIEGMDAVGLARDVLGLSLATEAYGSKFFNNGGRPAGILSTPATLDTEQRKKLREDWEVMNAGMQNANRTAVIWGDLRYTALASNNDQNQFLETRNHQIEEVCRALGVNPLMIYYSDKTSTYASSEQMFTQHVRHTLDPWYVNFEQSAALRLLTKEERRAGYYFKLLSNGLMRGVAKDRGEYYKSMRTIGAMTINEIRELEEMNPVEGGDNPFVPLNSNVAASDSEQDAAQDKGEDNGS